jgi:hypothetical protein
MWPTFQLNYLAVVVAAVVAWAIRALWYSPALFARAWVAAHGHTPEDLARMKASAGRAYAVSLLCYLLLAATLGILASYMALSLLHQGLQLGLLVWGGVALPLSLVAHVFSQKRWAAWGIDAGYQLVYLVAMSLIVVSWR